VLLFEMTLTRTAYSGIMDLIFAIIPWKIIMRMQMETKEKIGVALAMSMGVLWVLPLLARRCCLILIQRGRSGLYQVLFGSRARGTQLFS
jgi:hypothetical protein